MNKVFGVFFLLYALFLLYAGVQIIGFSLSDFSGGMLLGELFVGGLIEIMGGLLLCMGFVFVLARD